MPDAPVFDRYLYAIEFSDGVVKVGRTKDPVTRRKAHSYEARERGAQLLRCWVSSAHIREDVLEAESLLIAFCAERWRTAWGREYFAGADLEQVVEYAVGIDDVLLIFTNRADHLLAEGFAA